MGEHDSNIRPENPWENCNCIVETDAPMLRVANVPLEVVRLDPAAGDVYNVKKADYPNGLVVVKEDSKPDTNTEVMTVIFTERDEINLPLNGWPRGGGVIFL